MKQFIRSFGFSLSLSIIAIGGVFTFLGPTATLTTLVLAAIELAFSFDNAIINAKILARLSSLWRKLFLSVGILIAIFGMRLLLPLLVVGISAHLSLATVLDLALHHPNIYAEKLVEAYPSITAFGGAFLMMLSLHFFMADRDIRWIGIIERPLGLIEKWWLPLVIMIPIVLGLSLVPFNSHGHATLIAGLAGLVTYTLLNGLISIMGKTLNREINTKHVGWAAFAIFMYLELLDASLSFDGVIGAFAITDQVVLIAIGLGIGAVWVRSLTVHMVRHKTLEAYRYLEHGAHYAITILALTMLLSMVVDVPDFPVGLLCLGLIAASLVSSRQALQKE